MYAKYLINTKKNENSMLYKAKFFGSKEERGQITKQTEYIDANSQEEVESKLRKKYAKVNNLKIRQVNE